MERMAHGNASAFHAFQLQPPALFSRGLRGYSGGEISTTRKEHHMGSVVVYHFEMPHPQARESTRSKRPGTREAIEALGFTPIMETAQVVERTLLDGSGFLRPDIPRESAA
jgi:hypothetical protein